MNPATNIATNPPKAQHTRAESKLPLILRGIAVVTSATSAVAAYPVASSMFGMVAGGVIVTASAAAVYGGWHYVGTEPGTHLESWLKRTGAGTVAGLFSVGLVAGIYVSATQQTDLTNQQAAKQSDALYQEQEQSRIRNLDKLTQELRDTSKKNHPEEYRRLQEEISKLSNPLPRTQTATQKNTAAVPVAYKWGIASAFEIVTPALLILAGLFSRRREEKKQQLTAVAPGVVQAVAPVDQGQQPQPQVIDNIELPQLTERATPTATPGNPATTAPEPDDDPDPIGIIAQRGIPTNDEGCVTAAALESQIGCTNKQARLAIAEAVTHGYLIKTGKGGATRYRYPTLNQTTLWSVK